MINQVTNTTARTLMTAALLLAIVTAIDFFTGYEISFSSFYLLPILLVTWRTDLKTGLLVSLLSALLWLLNDHWVVEHQYSHPLIPYWNALVRLTFFALFSILLDRVRALLRKSEDETRLKSSMIHAVSHEFNNALTGISAALFLLEETETDRSEVRSRLYRSLSSAQQKLKIYVKNILNEARMEHGRFQLEKRPVIMREIAEAAIEPMEEPLRQKKISLVRDLPPVPVLVDADKDALALVISNLLGNAVKYTPTNGTITVRVSPLGELRERVIFSVDDTGPGIPLEDIRKITTGFYRTAEGKASAEGFGLGLKISNELLHLHDSRLEIASERGRGSSFYFELPALPSEGTASGTAS